MIKCLTSPICFYRFLIKILLFLNDFVEPRIDPDAPLKFFIILPWEIIGAENFSGKFEWSKPALRKGIIRKYVLGGSCLERQTGESAISLPETEFTVHDDTRDSYQLELSSLPSFSTCKISVAAATSVGIGENADLEVQTPLLCKTLIAFQSWAEILTFVNFSSMNSNNFRNSFMQRFAIRG